MPNKSSPARYIRYVCADAGLFCSLTTFWMYLILWKKVVFNAEKLNYQGLTELPRHILKENPFLCKDI